MAAKKSAQAPSDRTNGKPAKKKVPVSFAFEGVAYTIDLSEKKRKKLAKALAPYLAKAATVTKPKRARKATPKPKPKPAAASAKATAPRSTATS